MLICLINKNYLTFNFKKYKTRLKRDSLLIYYYSIILIAPRIYSVIYYD